MRNLQTEVSVHEDLIQAGKSPDAVPDWVARPLAVRQMERAQAVKEQGGAVKTPSGPDQEQVRPVKASVGAGGDQESVGKPPPIGGVPGAKTRPHHSSHWPRWMAQVVGWTAQTGMWTCPLRS